MSEREQLMRKLSGAQFAALEMRLYLDTHKHDATALKSMREYQKQANQYREEYEKRFGPITADDIFGDMRFNWINAPWPWETESEAKQ